MRVAQTPTTPAPAQGLLEGLLKGPPKGPPKEPPIRACRAGRLHRRDNALSERCNRTTVQEEFVGCHKDALLDDLHAFNDGPFAYLERYNA